VYLAVRADKYIVTRLFRILYNWWNVRNFVILVSDKVYPAFIVSVSVCVCVLFAARPSLVLLLLHIIIVGEQSRAGSVPVKLVGCTGMWAQTGPDRQPLRRIPSLRL
jgi:hypothetical protein